MVKYTVFHWRKDGKGIIDRVVVEEANEMDAAEEARGLSIHIQAKGPYRTRIARGDVKVLPDDEELAEEQSKREREHNRFLNDNGY